MRAFGRRTPNFYRFAPSTGSNDPTMLFLHLQLVKAPLCLVHCESSSRHSLLPLFEGRAAHGLPPFLRETVIADAVAFVRAAILLDEVFLLGENSSECAGNSFAALSLWLSLNPSSSLSPSVAISATEISFGAPRSRLFPSGAFVYTYFAKFGQSQTLRLLLISGYLTQLQLLSDSEGLLAEGSLTSVGLPNSPKSYLALQGSCRAIGLTHRNVLQGLCLSLLIASADLGLLWIDDSWLFFRHSWRTDRSPLVVELSNYRRITVLGLEAHGASP